MIKLPGAGEGEAISSITPALEKPASRPVMSTFPAFTTACCSTPLTAVICNQSLIVYSKEFRSVN